jgi:hypothetical protein
MITFLLLIIVVLLVAILCRIDPTVKRLIEVVFNGLQVVCGLIVIVIVLAIWWRDVVAFIAAIPFIVAFGFAMYWGSKKLDKWYARPWRGRCRVISAVDLLGTCVGAILIGGFATLLLILPFQALLARMPRVTMSIAMLCVFLVSPTIALAVNLRKRSGPNPTAGTMAERQGS